MSKRYDDLVLHLNLDDIDISTSTTPDSSKSGLKAKVNGARLVEDDTFGACLNFKRPDDHVEVSSLDLTGANPSHTIEAWIKVEAYPQARSWILLLGQNAARSHHWLLNAENAGSGMDKRAQLGVWGDVGGQATPVVPLADWVQIAAAYDGSNLVYYLNGQPIDKPKAATFNLTHQGLTLGKSWTAAEKNFQGKIAHVRIYRRALSEAEIREDMDTDRLTLATYRRGHPIGFSLSDQDENYVLYIGDDPKDHHHVNLGLRNTSAQAIRFKKEEQAADKASGDNHHFELVFRSGVLSDKTLKMLRENQEDVIVKEAQGQWDLFCPPRADRQTGIISVYFLYKDTSKLFGAGESLVIPLRNISANAGSGARGTRIELKLNQLTYDGETTPITGSRIQHLQIISHLGSRRVPLHVGFIGSNRVLNDGSSANTLVLQLMNVLKSEGDTSLTLTKDSAFFISFDVQSAKEVAPWSLCDEKEIDALKAGDNIIVAKTDSTGKVIIGRDGKPESDTGRWQQVTKTDHGQGESPEWKIAPRQDIVLQRDGYILIYISDIKTSLPSGLTNLYLDYKRMPGFWDGQVVCPIEKAPLLFYDVKDNRQKYTRELRVGIGCVKPEAKLEIALVANDADTKPLVIRKENVSYLTVLKDGKVGIGRAAPQALLDVNGEIRANFFRAGQGYSRRLPVGKIPVGTGPSLDATVWDEDIKWYRIAKIATPEPMIAGAEFSLRATVAGKTFGNVTFRIMTFSGLTRLAKKRPFARFTILSNTALLSFSKARIVIPSNVQQACEGYLEILVRQSPDGETEVNFSIYDNLNTPAWEPIAWEEQPAALPDTLVAVEHRLESHLLLVADATERFSVGLNGYVGIGTTSPQNQLHVGSGSSSIAADRVNAVVASQTVDAGIAIAQRDGVNVLLQASGAGGYIGTASNHALVLRTSNADRVVVDADGNVDIGGSLTVKQGERLDVIKTGDWKDPQLDKWSKHDSPIMKYFGDKLLGKPPGTALRAIAEIEPNVYWEGWVDAHGRPHVAIRGSGGG